MIWRSVPGLFGFTSRAITPAWGTSSESSSSRLGISSVAMMLTPVRLPPGRARLATRPARPGRRRRKDDRDRRGRVFCRQCRRSAAAGRDHVDLAADEIGGQCGQPIIVALRPAVFDRHVLSLDIAGFAQSLAERGHNGAYGAGRPAAEEADHRHRLLLRAERRVLRSSRRRAGAQARAVSFDHLVGAGEDRLRHGQAERLGGLEIDDQLEFGRLLRPADRPAWRP